MNTHVHTVMDSPVGPMRLVADQGKLIAIFMEQTRYPPTPEYMGRREDGSFVDIVRQLDEYFAGSRTEFDIPIQLRGTGFQRRVWGELLAIPYGETRTYGEIARKLGNAQAMRAVGLANGANPISIVVPCHRVIGANNSLTGYGGGLGRKKFLLDLEQSESRLF